MAKTNQENETKPALTRAEKKDAVKKLVKELLEKSAFKSNDLIDEAAKVYAEKFGGEENENPNDVKGRIGSVLDVMKKDGEVQFEGGMYSLKAVIAEEKPKAKRTTKKKAEVKEEPAKEEPQAEEKPKAKRTAKKKTEAKEEPVKEEPQAEEKPKAKRTAKKKTEVKAEAVKEEAKETPAAETVAAAEEKPVAVESAPAVETEVKQEEKPEEKQEEKKAEVKETTVMDMSFLFGEVKPKKEEQKRLPEKEEPKRLPEKSEANQEEPKSEEPKAQIIQKKLTPPTAKKEIAPKPIPKKESKIAPRVNNAARNKPKTADEKLQEAFLQRLHRLGGDYFEYYSVYLLEKYSRRNGRRLESMKICGGDHDGGIDGEIELTDRLGFRETIYIQAKNWDPDKGDERLWTVGETLLQQFIGACVCRQAKDGKQHCRGIFITTSRFTAEAKRILEQTSDKFVGYDGADLFETAKECEFGIIRKNGEWALDETLLSGERALFNVL